MDSMYESLIEYYDELFPVTEARLGFVEKFAKRMAPGVEGATGARVLDIGSATGTFSIALMRRGMNVTGIDLNPAMVQSACRRNPEPRTNCRFLRMDMMETGKALAHEAWDIVLCLGNTLVHLSSMSEIRSFISQVYSLLKPGGYFIFQVVNYERIIAEKMSGLPPIETGRARFERDYRFRDDGRVVFETGLFSSSGQLVFRDSVVLFPAKIDELSAAAKAAGFAQQELFDDFDEAAYTGTDLGLVCVLQK